MSKFALVCSMLLVSNVFAKTYVIPSHQEGCSKVLEVTTEGVLSQYQKSLRVSFVGVINEKKKVFTLESINRYYDSVWIDYYSKDGEKLEYYWDDGYGIEEGIRFRDCLYTIQ